MLAYHWLRDDLTAGHGREKAWTLGEERSIKGKVQICERGYHSSPTPWDGLEYAPGPILTLVEIGEPEAQQADKYVSRTRKLLAVVNVEAELRQSAVDCAERALQRERDAGREPDERSWAAIEAAKAFLRGEIAPEELAAAGDAAGDAARAAARSAARAAAGDAARAAARSAARAAAGDAAWAAAWAAAWSAARSAAGDAARAAARSAAWSAAGDAAWAAAWSAEREWQRQRFTELVMPKIDAAARFAEVG